MLCEVISKVWGLMRMRSARARPQLTTSAKPPVRSCEQLTASAQRQSPHRSLQCSQASSRLRLYVGFLEHRKAGLILVLSQHRLSEGETNTDDDPSQSKTLDESGEGKCGEEEKGEYSSPHDTRSNRNVIKTKLQEGKTGQSHPLFPSLPLSFSLPLPLSLPSFFLSVCFSFF